MEEKYNISKYHGDMVERFAARRKGEEEPPGEDFNGITELEYYRRGSQVLEE